MTPYIFDDRCNFEHVAEKLRQWYDTPAKIRKEYGMQGLKFVSDPKIGMSAKNMGDRFIKNINLTFDKWTPRKAYTLFNAGE